MHIFNKIILNFIFFMTFTISHGAERAPEVLQVNEIIKKVQVLYQHERELRDTLTYRTLVTGEIVSGSLFKYATLGFSGALCDVAYRLTQHNGASVIIKAAERFVPQYLHDSFRQFVTTTMFGLHGYNFYNNPLQHSFGYAFGLSGVFLTQHALGSSYLSRGSRRECEAFVYYCCRKAGWESAEMFSEGLHSLSENIFQTAIRPSSSSFFVGAASLENTQEYVIDLNGSSDSKMSREKIIEIRGQFPETNGTLLPKCEIDPCQDPQIFTNIQEGYTSIEKCNLINGLEEEKCLKNYINELPNYAYHPDVWKCLYQSQPSFIAAGGYSRVYLVKLRNQGEPIALKAFIKSTYGESSKSITHYIRETRKIEDCGKGLSDFIPKIYGIYFGAIPEDISSIALYEGTNVNQGIFPKEAHSFLPRGSQTGHIPEHILIRYQIKGYNDGMNTAVLPVLFTHLEFIKGGTLKNQKASLSTLLEIGLMEFIFLKNNFKNTDLNSGNIGMQPVDYWRAYSLENGNNCTYLMKETNSPKILDLDQSNNYYSFKDNDKKTFVPETFLRFNLEKMYSDKLIDTKAYSLIKRIAEHGLFSKEISKDLSRYCVSEEFIKDQEQKGVKIRRYH